MYYEKYKDKPDKTLIEILNSDSYQLSARETAEKILKERRVENIFIDNSDKLKQESFYQLIEKLNNYNISVYSNSKRRTVELIKDNKGLITGVILLFIAGLALILTILIIFFVNFTDSFARGYLAKYGYITIAFCASTGLMQLKRDKMIRVIIDFRENQLKLIKRHVNKRVVQKYHLKEKSINFSRNGEKRFRIEFNNESERIELFDIKENNVGNKTNDLFSILMEKIDNEITFANNSNCCTTSK
nr:hypothetical protein [uncultured Carboxylicivirga sp.]